MSSPRRTHRKAMRRLSSLRPCWLKWQENCVKHSNRFLNPPRKRKRLRWKRNANSWRSWKSTGTSYRNTTTVWTRCRTGIPIPKRTMTLLSWEWRRMPCVTARQSPVTTSRSAPGTSSLPTLHSSRTLRIHWPWYLSCNPSQADMTGWPIRWLPIPATVLRRITASCQKTVWKPTSSTTTSTWNSGRDSNRTRSRPKTSTTMKNMTSASALWGKGCGG